jgi:hypothetical protein
MTAVMEGKRPDRIPLAIYGGYIHDGNYTVWEPFIKQGLCHMPRLTVVRATVPGLEETVTRKRDDARGYDVERRVLRTPVGELTQTRHNGWERDFFLKTPGDYKVMKYILQHTELEPVFEQCAESEEKIGDTGLTIIRAERSPLQKIIVDYAGLENFSYHIADCEAEVHGLLEVLEDYLAKYYAIVSRCPIRYVQFPENLTSEQTGPARYQRYHMPYYKKVISTLHDAGKKVFVHYDGKIACLANLISQTGIDGIESFTTFPEGDMAYGEARAAFKNKFIMANIGIGDYALPPDALRARIQHFIREGAPDGRNLLFEISETLPVNWRQSLPLVLDTLAEYSLN